MFKKVILFLFSLSISGLTKASSEWNPSSDPIFSGKIEADTWCPKHDLIYDEKDGTCYYENTPWFRFQVDGTTSSRVVGSKVVSQKASDIDFFDNHFESIFAHNSSESRSSSYLKKDERFNSWDSKESPQTLTSLSPTTDDLKFEFQRFRDSPATYNCSGSQYAPRSCRNYKKMWEFYFGLPEDESTCFGWISRLAYTSDMIKDLNLRNPGHSFTLIRSKFMEKSILRDLLHDALCFEFQVPLSHLYSELCKISNLTDLVYMNLILGIVFTFNQHDDNLSVKILGNKNSLELYRALKMRNPNISCRKGYYQ